MNTKATSTRTLLLMLVTVFAALALVACAGPKEPETLEEYFAANPDQWESFQSSYNPTEGVANSSLEVKGNEIIMAASYDIDVSELPPDTIAQLDSMLEPYFEIVPPAIADLEKEVGIEGITMKVELTDSAGTEIASYTFDNAGRV